jgi:hypothetical protein
MIFAQCRFIPKHISLLAPPNLCRLLRCTDMGIVDLENMSIYSRNTSHIIALPLLQTSNSSKSHSNEPPMGLPSRTLESWNCHPTSIVADMSTIGKLASCLVQISRLACLRIPVRDVSSLFSLTQSPNHITETAQTFIDILSLLHSVALSPRLLQPLRTC